MIKSLLEIAYKVFYNHHVVLDKSTSGAVTMAKIHIITLILLVILNLLVLLSILKGTNLLPSSKPVISLSVAAYLIFGYQLISLFVKVDNPINGFFDDININTTRSVWIIYGALLALLFIQALVRKFSQ